MKRIWNFFASTGLTVALAVLICITASWGSVVCIRNPEVFRALDQAILFPWLLTVGRANLHLSLWIFILVILMALFALNTVVCTLDRLASIIKRKRPWQSFFPHIVHLGFLVALVGHLAGSTYGFRSPENFLFKGELTQVPDAEGLSVRLDDVEMSYSPSGDIDSLKTTVTLLEDDEEALTDAIEINGPLIYRGIAFYHVDGGTTPTGLVLDVDGETMGVKFGGSFTAPDGKRFFLGALYPDLALDEQGRPYSRSNRFRNPFQEIFSETLERAFLNVSRPGNNVTLAATTIGLRDYETTLYAVLAINRDPGIWFIIAGSSMLVIGMVLLLFLRGERGELVRQGPGDGNG
jgi:cytochrome c biogenesis protein ResB